MKVTEERLRILNANNEELHLETRQCIKSALIELMNKSPFEDISMTDIIRKSGVSRTGVYKNYKSKAEIMYDIYKEPIDEVLAALNNSISDNLETAFRIGKKHEKAIKAIINAGLEYNILKNMNARYEGVSASFYTPLWNGMIFNSFIEWAKTGMDEPVETTVVRLKAGLKLVAESIETELANKTQNKRLCQGKQKR